MDALFGAIGQNGKISLRVQHMLHDHHRIRFTKKCGHPRGFKTHISREKQKIMKQLGEKTQILERHRTNEFNQNMWTCKRSNKSDMQTYNKT